MQRNAFSTSMKMGMVVKLKEDERKKEDVDPFFP